MDELHFDELLEMEISKIRTSRSKPVKRMWREIEAIRDRKRLEKELLDMDVCLDADDIKFKGLSNKGTFRVPLLF